MYLNHFLFVKDEKEKKVGRLLKGSVSIENVRKGYLLSEIASWNGGSASKKSSLNSHM